jgi:hypothetical protein
MDLIGLDLLIDQAAMTVKKAKGAKNIHVFRGDARGPSVRRAAAKRSLHSSTFFHPFREHSVVIWVGARRLDSSKKFA